MDTDQEIRFLIIKNGSVESISVDDAKTLVGAVVTDPDPADPVDPTPVPLALYGAPRTLVCENFNGHKLYAGTGIGCLLEVFDDSPDSFVRRGGNLRFDKIANNIALPFDLIISGRDGMDEPILPRPDGYVQDYFEGDKRIYWRKGTDPDRIYTPPVTNGGGTKPNVPVIVPDKPVDNTPPVVNTKPDVVVDMDSVMTLSNRQLFTPVIEWKNGKARLTHPNRPDGNHLYILSGQPELSELPTTYDFSPGQEVVVDYQHATSSAEFWFWDLIRGQAIIHFGQPVLTTA